MLKSGQKVLLPIHEEIGEVISVTENKAVIRVTKPNEVYDVVVTPEGNMPHTNCSIVEHLLFNDGEFAFIKKDNAITLGQISNIRVLKSNLVCDFIVGETETKITIIEQPIDGIYKLFGLYKHINKMVKSNDKFKRD